MRSSGVDYDKLVIISGRRRGEGEEGDRGRIDDEGPRAALPLIRADSSSGARDRLTSFLGEKLDAEAPASSMPETSRCRYSGQVPGPGR